MTTKQDKLPVILVKDMVLFPHNLIPLTAGQVLSAESLEKLARHNRVIGVVTYKNVSEGTTDVLETVHKIGTEAKILKILRFPDETLGVVVQGGRRFRINSLVPSEGSTFLAEVEYLEDLEISSNDVDMLAISKGLKQLIGKAISLSPNIPNDVSIFIENIQDLNYLGYLIIPYLSIDVNDKQELLSMSSAEDRLRKIHYFLVREIEILEISQKIHSDIRLGIGKQQRKYYVNEQIKLLQKELGELNGNVKNLSDPADIMQRIEQLSLSPEAKEAVTKEADRLQNMQAGSPEYTVSQSYINWILDLPWGVYSQKKVNLSDAQIILNEDHYGLDKVKRRVLEYLAVLSLKQNLKGPILLFVGPPGVGKTSLGKSIARALGRKFQRIALGGVRDEAEIRGHRRTYIGSMPGKIIDAIKKAGVMDPVILLDEVDKISADNRGDPTSALLEVLDSEQNHTFTDHYLNIPFDLSKVLFLCTANVLYSIPEPLKDRMEIIEINSYILQEKSQIAFKHLLPQIIEEHGLNNLIKPVISEKIMESIITNYTREAGVRQLRRELSGLARVLAMQLVEKHAINIENNTNSLTKIKAVKKNIDKVFIESSLGPVKFLDTMRSKNLKVGVSLGLAYTPVGGDVLFIESALSENGKGVITITGQLGEVMRESVQTAFSFIKANASQFNINNISTDTRDIHVHFPEGAVKKDGPSAGVAIFLALSSLFLNKNIAADMAVTGEISLRGDILPVGGIKEKLLAAHRYGLKRVFIPKQNKKDLLDLPKEVLEKLSVIEISTMQEAYSLAFAEK